MVAFLSLGVLLFAAVVFMVGLDYNDALIRGETPFWRQARSQTQEAVANGEEHSCVRAGCLDWDEHCDRCSQMATVYMSKGELQLSLCWQHLKLAAQPLHEQGFSATLINRCLWDEIDQILLGDAADVRKVNRV